jgi:hypothetical protein
MVNKNSYDTIPFQHHGYQEQLLEFRAQKRNLPSVTLGEELPVEVEISVNLQVI